MFEQAIPGCQPESKTVSLGDLVAAVLKFNRNLDLDDIQIAFQSGDRLSFELPDLCMTSTKINGVTVNKLVIYPKPPQLTPGELFASVAAMMGEAAGNFDFAYAEPGFTDVEAAREYAEQMATDPLSAAEVEAAEPEAARPTRARSRSAAPRRTRKPARTSKAGKKRR